MADRRRLASARGFERGVYVVAAGRFVNVFGSGVVYPFATLYFHLTVGLPLSVVGAGLLANNVGLAVGTLVGGYLADRHGRKPVMIASMGLSAPALAAYALVTTAGGFVAVATAAGLAMGLYAPASQALVADLSADAERERAYGLLKVASNAGFGSGFVAGGLLFGVARTAVFVVDGATSAVVAALFVVLLPRGHGRSRASAGLRETAAAWGRAASRPLLLWVALLNVGFAVMYSQMGSTVPVYAAETLGLTSEALGTLFVLNPLVIVLFQLPAVARVSAWRRTRGLVLSAGFWAASFLALVAVPAVPAWVGVGMVGAFLVLRTVGEIFHSPLVTALASDLGPVSDRGTQLSVVQVAYRLGFGVGPVVGGLFFDYGAAVLLWPTLLAGCVALALGLLALERRVPGAANAPAPATD